MKLLAVSGGPDSMWLLYKYKTKNIVVAHVNYHAREDSGHDQTIVEEYCKRYKIPFRVLSLNKKPKTNFQSWAREQRFRFFKKIYDEFSCNRLILGHHKDDFLETALMQSDSKREPRQFGILVKNQLYGMVIFRPFIKKYWKSEILELCREHNVTFATDSTNSQPIYTRNKKRIELKDMTLQDKKQRLNWYKMVNFILYKKYKKVDYLYKKWEKTNFSITFLNFVKFQEELLFSFITNNIEDAKITKNKLKSILNFIQANNEAKEYKISDDLFISKKNKVLKIK